MNSLITKYRLIGLTLIVSILFAPIAASADYKSRADWLKSQYDTLYSKSSSATGTDALVINVQLDMLDRQIDAAHSLSNLDTRVEALLSDDPRKDGADDRFDTAEGKLDTFLALDPTKTDPTSNKVLLVTDYEPYNAVEKFTDAEKTAMKAISEVNRALLAPVKPNKNVIEGDILDDFLPGVIRLLMRFASLAVLVSFVISGVFLVMAFGNDERVTKAKHMLYYSLIGFAFVALAFAIVKAVTDIDFFGFI